MAFPSPLWPVPPSHLAPVSSSSALSSTPTLPFYGWVQVGVCLLIHAPPHIFLLIIVKSQIYYFSFPGSWLPWPCIEALATSASSDVAPVQELHHCCLCCHKSYPHSTLQTGSPSHAASCGLTSRSTILPVAGTFCLVTWMPKSELWISCKDYQKQCFTLQSTHWMKRKGSGTKVHFEEKNMINIFLVNPNTESRGNQGLKKSYREIEESTWKSKQNYKSNSFQFQNLPYMATIYEPI